MTDNPFKIPYCPLYGTNVIISEYNKNGQCKCLSCSPFGMRCQACEYRDELVAERTSMIANRCIQCYTLGAKTK